MEKAIARHEIKGTLDDLISVAAYLLPNKGRFYVIYPASRAVDLMAALRQHRLEPKRMRWIHPRADQEARWLLVEALNATGVELHVLSPLVFHP